MELRHLRYFAAVAQYLNYSEASRRLHVAQPAISQTILDLEDWRVAHTPLRSKFEPSPCGHSPNHTKVGTNPPVRRLAQICQQPRAYRIFRPPASGDSFNQNPNGKLTTRTHGWIY